MPVFITADKIHNGEGWLPPNTSLQIDDEGKILDLLSSVPTDATHYPGILCPAFINAHCHLELSHLLGKIPKHTGLKQFLLSVMSLRNQFGNKEKEVARRQALIAMKQEGIIAIGDISNTDETIDLSALEGMHMHKFVECIGMRRAMAEESMQKSLALLRKFDQATSQSSCLHHQSIAPHAPYSVSTELFQLIAGHLPNTTTSIHNQEWDAENDFYRQGEGEVRSLLQEIGVGEIEFQPTHKSALQSVLPYLQSAKEILLVHNISMSDSDLNFLNENFAQKYWLCLCPNANLYISHLMPPIKLIVEKTDRVCIGTDSLASNDRLSIWSELQTIARHYPEIHWNQLLRWATSNGAKALGFQHTIGKIEKGFTPGLLYIKDLKSTASPVRIL